MAFSDSKKDILIIGDSFSESSFVAEEARFAALLERHFCGDVEVFNYSYSGTTSLQILFLILAKVVTSHDPTSSVVLIFLPTSDADAFELEQGYWNNSIRYSPLLPASNTSRNAPVSDCSKYRAVVSSICDTLENFDFQYLLVNTPYQQGTSAESIKFLSSYFGTEERAKAVITARKKLSQLAVEMNEFEGRPLIDLTSSIGSNAKYFYDDRHLNREGSIKVAETLIATLRNFVWK